LHLLLARRELVRNLLKAPQQLSEEEFFSTSYAFILKAVAIPMVTKIRMKNILLKSRTIPHAVITKLLLVTLPTNSGLTDHVSIISLNFRSPRDKGTITSSDVLSHAKTIAFCSIN